MTSPVRMSRSEDWELAQRPPSAALQPYVAGGYFGYRETMAGPCLRLEYPAAVVPVIFNFGSRYQIKALATSAQALLPSFAAGLTRHPVLTQSDGQAYCLQVNLKPAAARRIFAMPMTEIADQAVDLAELLGLSVRALEEQLAGANDWDRRFALVDGFLLSLLGKASDDDPRMAAAWQRLEASAGNLSLGALAAEFDLTPKGLIALFREHTGLTPKLAARIVRFEGALRELRSGTLASLADLAAAAGYADQAHFTREFADFTGTTPGAFEHNGP